MSSERVNSFYRKYLPNLAKRMDEMERWQNATPEEQKIMAQQAGRKLANRTLELIGRPKTFTCKFCPKQ